MMFSEGKDDVFRKKRPCFPTENMVFTMLRAKFCVTLLNYDLTASVDIHAFLCGLLVKLYAINGVPRASFIKH